MSKTRHFLLNRFSALGFVGRPHHWRWSERERPRGMARYLASRRIYGGLHVQPLLVPTLPERDPMDGSLGYEEPGWGYINTGRYEVTISHEFTVDLLDAIHGALAMVRRMEFDEDLILVPLAEGDIPPTRMLSSQQLDAVFRRTLPGHAAHVSAVTDFNDAANYGLHSDDFLWRVCARLLLNAAHTRAAHYLRSATRHISLLHGPVDDQHALFEEMPSRIREQVLIESSIQDCLKTIETLYGGMLSRNDNRVSSRLIEIGVDPNEVCGFTRKPYAQAKVIDKVLALRSARDGRAAHGGSAESRRNSLYDLCDFQQLASLIVWRAVCRGDEPLLRGEPLHPQLLFDPATLKVRRQLPRHVRRKQAAGQP